MPDKLEEILDKIENIAPPETDEEAVRQLQRELEDWVNA